MLCIELPLQHPSLSWLASRAWVIFSSAETPDSIQGSTLPWALCSTVREADSSLKEAAVPMH